MDDRDLHMKIPKKMPIQFEYTIEINNDIDYML